MRIPELEREEVNAVCLISPVWILTWVYDHMCMIPRVFDDQMDLPRLRPSFAELVSYPKVALRRWRFPLGQRKRCDYQARRGGCHLGTAKLLLYTPWTSDTRWSGSLCVSADSFQREL